MRRSLSLILVLFLALTLCFGCGDSAEGPSGPSGNGGETGEGTGDETGESEGIDLKDMEQLLQDTLFEQGFGVKATSTTISTEVIRNFDFGGTAVGEPVWTLGQWGQICKKWPELSEEQKSAEIDRHDLTLATETESDGVYRYSSASGSKVFSVRKGEGEVTMRLETSLEYQDHPRENGWDWPHMLMEQQLAERKLTELDHLYYEVEFTLDECTKKMSDAAYQKNLHTVQLLWTSTLKNCNPEKPGDMMWMNLKFFDARYLVPPFYAAADSGKDTASQKFIYTPAGDEFMETPVRVGERQSLLIDALPFMREAFALAQTRGYLKGLEFSDLAVGSAIFGFEIPGTYDAQVTLHKIGVYADPKEAA